MSAAGPGPLLGGGETDLMARRMPLHCGSVPLEPYSAQVKEVCRDPSP